jgi:N-acetylglucosaminyldiphosphoundecaprenol N-acetyl-beta-D-mannosaminyltransferase
VAIDIARVDILGVRVSAIDMEMALNTVDNWIRDCAPNYICVTAVNNIIESQSDEELKRIHNSAGLVTPDGMPLVWLCKLMGFRDVDRVYGPDLMLAVCERGLAYGWRHYFYGGSPEVLELLVQKLRRRFPELAVSDSYSPPFRPLTQDEDAALIERINATRADIVWVGISTPKQERWMAEHVQCLRAAVLIGVGAAFDFHAGVKRQAPRWLQRLGLEWSFRLMVEPRRLWRRYLIGNPKFLWLIFLQALGRRGVLPGS